MTWSVDLAENRVRRTGNLRTGLKFSATAADLFQCRFMQRSKELAADDVRDELGSLIQNFEADAAVSPNRSRTCSTATRPLLTPPACQCSTPPVESRGSQYPGFIARRQRHAAARTLQPELSRDEAIALARAARRSDPEIDVVIARSLADSALGGGQVRVENPARLLDILPKSPTPAASCRHSCGLCATPIFTCDPKPLK